MKKIFIFCFFISSLSSFGQNTNPTKYSKLFDAYYKKGPLKYTFEPGLAIQSGISYTIGASVNYKFNAPIEGVLGFRAVGLSTENLMQINLLGRYYFRYDRIRTNYDRRQSSKIWNLYALTGVAFAPLNLRVDIPLGIGIPFRLSERMALIPEFSYYYTFGKPTYMIATLGLEFNPTGKKKKENMRKRGKAFENAEQTDDSEPSNSSPVSPTENEEKTTPEIEETPTTPVEEPIPEEEEETDDEYDDGK